MTEFKLTYFDVDSGRGEPVRLAFHIGGIPFEDDRLSFSDFGAMRKATPFNSVPVLYVDGRPVTQSSAMCRYIGRLAGLYPDDPLQALYCDEVMEATEDLTMRLVATFGLKGDALKEAREKLVEGWLATFLRGLEGLLQRGGEYFADGRLTVADLKVFVQVQALGTGLLDHIPTDVVERMASTLATHRDRVAADERVAAYYAR